MKKTNYFKPVSMPCTEEQFNTDLKPYLLEAGVDLEECHNFNLLPILVNNFNGVNQIIGTTHEGSKAGHNRTEIPYNPKEFLRCCGYVIHPTVEEIIEYFKDAAEVECLYTGEVLKLSGKETECGAICFKNKTTGRYWMNINKHRNACVYNETTGQYAKITKYKTENLEVVDVIDTTELVFAELGRSTLSILNRIPNDAEAGAVIRKLFNSKY